MRGSNALLLERTGRPAIHELLHAMPGLYGDGQHLTEDVWAAFGVETAESRAMILFGAVASLEA